jgi:hypothetical protein
MVVRRAIKTLFINVAAFLCILSLANIFAVTALTLYNRLETKPHDKSHLLPNYANAGWAKKHFEEYNEQKVTYESYYEWRRLPFKGETINIDENGFRKTHKTPEANPQKTAAFFGGSTMWGTGADDDSTIPSEFAKINPDYAVINFGEQGYTAHQSLNLFLAKYYEGYKPDLVVFYDGVNDIGKCRRELHPYAHSREYRIKLVLDEASSENPESIFFAVLPIKNFISKVSRILTSRAAASFYDCDRDETKADLVARNLVSDWRLVKILVEGYGGTFAAILQPNAYFSNTREDQLVLDSELHAQFASVYPRVVEYVDGDFSDVRNNFYDFRGVVDVDDYVYIDFCHLSPNGNRMVADRISDVVRRRGLTGAAGLRWVPKGGTGTAAGRALGALDQKPSWDLMPRAHREL